MQQAASGAGKPRATLAVGVDYLEAHIIQLPDAEIGFGEQVCGVFRINRHRVSRRREISRSYVNVIAPIVKSLYEIPFSNMVMPLRESCDTALIIA